MFLRIGLHEIEFLGCLWPASRLPAGARWTLRMDSIEGCPWLSRNYTFFSMNASCFWYDSPGRGVFCYERKVIIILIRRASLTREWRRIYFKIVPEIMKSPPTPWRRHHIKNNDTCYMFEFGQTKVLNDVLRAWTMAVHLCSEKKNCCTTAIAASELLHRNLGHKLHYRGTP